MPPLVARILEGDVLAITVHSFQLALFRVVAEIVSLGRRRVVKLFAAVLAQHG